MTGVIHIQGLGGAIPNTVNVAERLKRLDRNVRVVYIATLTSKYWESDPSGGSVSKIIIGLSKNKKLEPIYEGLPEEYQIKQNSHKS